jgi:hypothetical protein
MWWSYIINGSEYSDRNEKKKDPMHLNNKMLSLVFYRVIKAASIAEKKS